MKKFRIIKFKTKPILEIKKVSKSFSNDHVVLNQISFHVNRGEIFGVLGPNGSGKTTIFNLILGILGVDSGKIFINGEAINSYPVYLRCRKYKLSYVAQNSGCLLGLSVQQNLEAISELKIKNKIKRKEVVRELLDFQAQNDWFCTRRIREFSRLQSRFAEFPRVTSPQPKVVGRKFEGKASGHISP